MKIEDNNGWGQKRKLDDTRTLYQFYLLQKMGINFIESNWEN